MAAKFKPSHTLGPDPMRYRDPDALCLPMRAPQHAAPMGFRASRRGPAGQLRFASRLRRLARQAVQMFVTTLAWAAGLGLVTGAIVFVAMTTGPAHNTRGNAPDSVALPPGWTGSSGSHGRKPVAYRVLADFTGHGSSKTAHFDVRAAREWQLKWAYRCGAQSKSGRFQLLAADRAILKASVQVTGQSGAGLASFKSSGRHYLVVKSGCSWRIQVVQLS
jgi:hypothetical protein